VNFTREPIIETVITPREGCKLVIRSSKGNGQEDFFVDAIEVVSFGSSIFYRSTERPKSFMLPVSDYEVLEIKETRMVLKSIGVERSIKIGSSSQRHEKHHPQQQHAQQGEAQETTASSQNQEKVSAQTEQQHQHPHQQQGGDRGKRDKRRSRRRRGGGGMEQKEEQSQNSSEPRAEAKEEGAPIEQQPPTTMISRLFPPPPTLIKEKLNRYKDTGVLEANLITDADKEKAASSAPDVMEFGKDQGFFREDSQEEDILPDDLKPRDKGLRDEPVYNPEYYEKEHPSVKLQDDEEQEKPHKEEE
jgi:hypothetical protein